MAQNLPPAPPPENPPPPPAPAPAPPSATPAAAPPAPAESAEPEGEEKDAPSAERDEQHDDRDQEAEGDPRTVALVALRRRHARQGHAELPGEGLRNQVHADRQTRAVVLAGEVRRHRVPDPSDPRVRDRKSTRRNSSRG